jgi:putative SOS response-associated peptidase YedK
MCSNYLPVTRQDRLLTFFGVEYEKKEQQQREVFPLGMAPFIRLTVEGQEGGKPALVAEDGMFGLLPHFAAERQYGRRTYNARSETVHKLPSFKPTWEAASAASSRYRGRVRAQLRVRQGRALAHLARGRCPVRHRRHLPPLESDPQGGPPLFTFTMLTVNADTHPFYKRFHKPGEEKRMPIFLDKEQYGPWLQCGLDEAPLFFKQHPGPFLGEAAPLARMPKVAKEPNAKDELLPPKPAKAPPPPPALPSQRDLF